MFFWFCLLRWERIELVEHYWEGAGGRPYQTEFNQGERPSGKRMGSRTETNIEHRQEESHFFMAPAGKQEWMSNR